MAVTEDFSAYSTTQASNTPAGTDNIGPDLDDHLRNLKENAKRAATHFVEDTAGSREGSLRGALWADPSASPTIVLRYDTGVGLIPIAEINESASSVSPYIGTTKAGSFGGVIVGQDSTASAYTALGFGSPVKDFLTATDTAAMQSQLGIPALAQSYLSATDTAALHAAIGAGTSATDLVELLTGSATSIAALPAVSGEFLTNISAFTEGNQLTATLAADSEVGTAHGLSTVDFVVSYLECLSADASYTVGDRIYMADLMSASDDRACLTLVNSASASFVIGVGIQAIDKSTFNSSILSLGAWQGIIRTFKLN